MLNKKIVLAINFIQAFTISADNPHDDYSPGKFSVNKNILLTKNLTPSSATDAQAEATVKQTTELSNDSVFQAAIVNNVATNPAMMDPQLIAESLNISAPMTMQPTQPTISSLSVPDYTTAEVPQPATALATAIMDLQVMPLGINLCLPEQETEPIEEFNEEFWKKYPKKIGTFFYDSNETVFAPLENESKNLQKVKTIFNYSFKGLKVTRIALLILAITVAKKVFFRK